MNAGRYGHTASLMTNGKVLVSGGFDISNSYLVNSTELYDSLTGTWTTTSSMNKARYLHTESVLTNGKVLVSGGLGLDYTGAELYDTVAGNSGLTCLSFDKEYKRIFLANRSGNVFLYDVSSVI